MLCSTSGGGCRASSAGMVRSEKGGSAAAMRHCAALRVSYEAGRSKRRRAPQLGRPLLVWQEGTWGRSRAERQRGGLRQLSVARSSSNGLEARADGLLRAAVPPACADKCASRVTQDAVQHQRAGVVDAVEVEDLQRLPVGAH